ncbi:hypothetical protein OV203_40210 [Nannocystis sp. ILAH1]|uniref:hypothetical protein n=1 Tax=Nannocystis sp. ILAH1 TaxID=2996789 RepID=UPI00226FFC3E|nr:hypothetical protein [Nannocystis sp. ILAH1]MCY0993431.1 hypothetical protein [Nannocystis sp. ILAH1]
MSARIFVPAFAMLLFTGACGDDGDGPEDTTGATAGAPTTDDTAATTDESPTSTTEATPTTSASDGETTTDATTDATTDVTTGDPSTDTGATTDADTTTGGLDPDALSACQAYCERWGECGFQPDLAGCIDGCSGNQIGLAAARCCGF